jgi:putative hemolysin
VTPFPWSDVLIIAGLILLNGLFSLSELAIVSARPARLKIACDDGSKGAEAAIRLANDPGKFLSTVQIGITLVGIVAGAFSGSRLGGPLGERLVGLGLPERYADQTGFAVAIAVTTYLSLVVGELVPKQVALRAAEPIAIATSRPMAFVAQVTAPLVWLLDRSSSLIMRALGIGEKGQATLTAQELHMVFAEATRSGVIEEGERAIMSGIMRLADRPCAR